MTKERYFISILCLVYPPIIILLIANIDDFVGEFPDAVSPVALGLVSLAISVFIFSFMLAAGMYFAEKIGARLLLLQENYNVKKDILKPALIIGVAISVILLMMRMIFPFDLFAGLEGNIHSSYKKLAAAFAVIQYDVRTLLFWMSGCALLIKTLTRSKAMDAIMYTSIVLIAFLFNIGQPIWNFGVAIIAVGAVVRCGIDIMLGVLFWKKGFEVAVLCHMIIALILYLIAPAVVLAIGA